MEPTGEGQKEGRKDGKIHTWTRCHFAGERFAADVPYTLALVEFDGAINMALGRLEGIEPEKIEIGMRVRVHSDEKGDYLRFLPI